MTRLHAANHDDRLAASYPFLTTLSTAVCGWLMERQADAASNVPFGRLKRSMAGIYLDRIVPKAMGLRGA